MESVTRVNPAGCTFSMLVPTRNRQNYEGSGYEAYSTVIFQASCSASDVVIDIGAHVGYYSLLARQANPLASIIAVEASPENHDVLAQNLASMGGEASTINAAFGDVQGTATIQLTEASDNCSAHGHPMSPTLGTVDVPAITSADLAIPPGSRITIKLDVEGSEVKVLDGLSALLDSEADHRLLIELNPKCLYRSESSPEALLGWLFSHNYRVFLLNEDRRDWAEVRAPGEWTAHLGPLEYANVYCIPADRSLTVSALMHHAGLGGAERSHVELVQELVQRGVMVHTIVPLPDEVGLSGDLERAGSSVTLVERYPWWMGPVSPADGEVADWQRGLVDSGVIDAIAAVRPDVVLTETGVVPQGAVAAAILGIPHAWYLREFGDWDHGYRLPFSPREFGALVRELSAVVVTNSAGVREHFFGDHCDDVTVIHPFPSLPAAGTPTHGDRPPTVGVVGGLNPGKGHEDVLQAVAVLRATGLDVPIVCVGPGEPEDQARLRDAAELLGVADLLTLRGPVRERSELYGLLDIVAVTSRAEAFGRVPFEATAAGVPVVYRDSHGPAEYMTAGVTGLAYAPGAIDELAAALKSLVEDASLRLGLVAAAREQLGDPARRAAYGESVIAALRRAAAGPGHGSNQLLNRWVSTAVTSALGRLRDDSLRLAATEVELREEIDRRGAEIERAQGSEQHLTREVARMQGAEQYLSSEVARLREVEQTLRGEAVRAEIWRSENVRDDIAHAAALAALHGEIEALKLTFSWRVTRPLRLARRLARRPVRFARRVARRLKWVARASMTRSSATIAPAAGQDQAGASDATPDAFDVAYYRNRQADLQSLTDHDLRLHYQVHGRAEGRRGQSVYGTSRKVIRSIDPNRETVFVVFHEATRTGAPVLGWNLVREMGRLYNVVAVLAAGGELATAIEEVASATVTLDATRPFDECEARLFAAALRDEFHPLYAIANSAATHSIAPALEHARVPVVGLVHEFASSMRPNGVLRGFFESVSEVVFSAEIVADSMRREYAGALARDHHIIAQGQSALPPGGSVEFASRVTRSGTDDVDVDLPERSLDDFLADLDPGTLLVIGAGTIAPRKGVEFFVQTAEQTRRIAPETPIAFAWIGGRIDPLQWYVEELWEQVERSGARDRVTFLAPAPDLEALFARSDVFFLSSRLDPMPNVTIDAALACVPVVAFDKASGFADWLQADQTLGRLVVPHLDVAAAATVIAELAADSDERARLGAALREAARTAFDMPGYVAKLDVLGLSARAAVDRAAEDIAEITVSGEFSTQLFAGAETSTDAVELVSSYVNSSRLAAPRARPRSGLLVRRPTEGFNPLIYAERAPGYDDERDGDPFADYLRKGNPRGPWVHEVLRPADPYPPLAELSPLRVLVHGHFHYPELVGNLVERLAVNETPVTVHLTTTSDEKAAEITRTLEQSGLADWQVQVVPNRGRDLAPLLAGIGVRAVQDFDLVLHVHGKRSPHVDSSTSERWRDFLWENLVGGRAPMLDRIHASFATQPTLGLAFPEDPHLNDWDRNRTDGERLAKRLGITTALPNHFDFPLGNMYWARTDAIRPLFEADFQWHEFPEEPLPIDGTILHALERLTPFVVAERGYAYATTVVPGVSR